MYTTVYPTAIVSHANLPVWIDDVDDVEAKVVNDPVTELIAVQAELGTLPSGSTADLTTRLAVSINDDGSLKSTLTPTFAGLNLTGLLDISGAHVYIDSDKYISFSGGTIAALIWYVSASGTLQLRANDVFFLSSNGTDMNAALGINIMGSGTGNKISTGALGSTSAQLYIGDKKIVVEDGAFTLGATNIGNDGTNYVEVKTDGEIVLHGTARVTNHLVISPAGIKMPAANFPSDGVVGIFPTLDFDAGASDESAHAVIHCPFRTDLSVDITVIISWTYEGDQDDGFVVWGLEYRGIKAGELVATAGTDITQKSAGTHTTGQEIRTTFSTKVLASALEHGDDIGFRIYRHSSDAVNDTLAVDAKLINVHLLFTKNALGEPL